MRSKALRWLALAGNAVDHLADWTDGTLVTAYHRRAQDRYRGPERWLQLTFDCLGKLAWAATRMRTVAPPEPSTDGRPLLGRPRDRLSGRGAPGAVHPPA